MRIITVLTLLGRPNVLAFSFPPPMVRIFAAIAIFRFGGGQENDDKKAEMRRGEGKEEWEERDEDERERTTT